MKQPFTLHKRGRYWYYKLAHEKTPHSTGKTTKAEANKVAVAVLNGDTHSTSKDITLAEFTKTFFVPGECKWLHRKQRKGKNITKQTAQMRRGHLVNHILPAFGERAVASVTTTEFDDWLIGLKRSNRTKNHIIQTARILWDEAVKSKIVDENPIEAIETFANNSQTRDAFLEAELKALFPESLSELTRIYGSLKYAALFLTLSTTGMRLGEALALTWGDWQEKSSTKSVLRITKAVKNDLSIGTTKTKTERTAFVTRFASWLLEAWYQESGFADADDLIFPNLSGNPLHRKECANTISGVPGRSFR